MNSQLFYEDHHSINTAWEEAEEIKIACHDCGYNLFRIDQGYSPDNISSYLICKFCGWEEKE